MGAGLGLRFHLGLDGISAPLVLLTAGLTFLVCLHLQLSQSLAAAARHPGLRQLLGCVLAVEGGAIATFLALDLLLWFVAFEIVLVPMWAIIRFWGDDHDPAARRDAAMRFVLFTALGSTAAAARHPARRDVARGTSDIVALTARHGDGIPRGVQVTAAALMVAGPDGQGAGLAAAHLAAAGPHRRADGRARSCWPASCSSSAPTAWSGWSFPLCRKGSRSVAPYLGGLGVVGILWGGLACLVERDLKRLVAYSSVAHMGFVAVGHRLRAAPQGLQGALFANVAHGLVTGLLFLVAGALKERSGGSGLAAIGSGAARAAAAAGLAARLRLRRRARACRAWPASGARSSRRTARGRRPPDRPARR